MTPKIVWFYILLLILFTATFAFSQSGSSLGIGGLTALSRGVEAIYWNPANLAFRSQSQPNFQMIVYSINAGTGNNSLSFNSINKYIGDGESVYLTDQDKQDILEMINDNGLQFDVTGNASLFSLSYKNFGFGIETRAFANFSIPKDLYENILFKLGQDTYDYSASGGGQGVAKFKLAYGNTFISDLIFEVPLLSETIFQEFSAGISLSYLMGVGYANIEKGMAKLSINETGILPSAEFLARSATFGSGIGMDIGLSTYTDNNWRIGLMFENILGSVKWNKDAKIASFSLDFGDNPLFILGENQLSEIEKDSVATDTTYSIDSFSKRLPFNFRMGIAKDFGKYLANLEIGHVNETTFATLGGRIKFGFFNWYVSVGRMLGNFNWNTAFALEFRNFAFDIGISSRTGLMLGHSKGLFAGSSMRFGF